MESVLHLEAKRILTLILKPYDIHDKGFKKGGQGNFQMEEVKPKPVQEVQGHIQRADGAPKNKGLGHPEALIGGGDVTWSRHITAHDRIIYDIYDDVVEVYVFGSGGALQ